MSQTPNMQKLVAQLRNLHSLYAHLTMEYLRLPLSCRKYVYGNESMPTHEVRAIAQAKFILAAALQWKSSHLGYNANNFPAATGATETKSGQGAGEVEDELCPIWIPFFMEMILADRLLSAYKDDPTYASTVFAYVEPLLRIAEDKFIWLHSLFTEVEQNGEYVRSSAGIELTESMIFAGWNRFCFNVAKRGLADALETVRPVRRRERRTTDTVHSGQSSRREFFSFAPPADFQPWVRVLPLKEFREHHPQCAVDSPCRRSPDFCPCKARGVECENWNCSRSGPWKWPCVPAEPQVLPTSVPSYGAGHLCVEDAWNAGDLESGVVFRTPQVSLDPHAVSPTPLLQTYNALWERLTSSDNEVVWPTPSFGLSDFKADAGLPLSKELLRTMPWDRLITLKVKAFFLSGLQVPYDVGEYPVREAVVVPRFATFDSQRMQALLQQMLLERQRWSYDGLSRRTGMPGYEAPTLGNDWLSWAVRDAIEELIECCCRAISKARRAEIYVTE